MKLFSHIFLSLSLLYAFFVILTIFTHPPYTGTASADNTKVLISQIQIAGKDKADQDFIELYNPTSATINLDGYRLVSRNSKSSTDNSIIKFSISDNIASHGYLLWCNKILNTALSCDKHSTDILSNNYSIALRFGSLNTGTIVDAVTIGAPLHPLGEGDIPATPSAGESIIRKATATSSAQSLMPGGSQADQGNGYDTNINAQDFVLLQTSMPRNSASPAAHPVPSISPTPSVIPTPTIYITPTPTATPTATPTIIPTATPVPEDPPTPSPAVSISSSPASSIIINDPVTPNSRFVCTQNYRPVSFLGFHFAIPVIQCRIVRS